MQWGFTYFQKCLQKCAKKLFGKSAPKIFSKVCQSIAKVRQNVWKSAPKKLFGKSAPKVRQKLQLWDKNENFLSPEPGIMGLYLPPKMFAKVRQSVAKVLQKCLKKCAKKTVWQKCTKNVCKSAPKNTAMIWKWKFSKSRITCNGALLTCKLFLLLVVSNK